MNKLKRAAQKILAGVPIIYLRILQLLRRGNLEKRIFLSILRKGDTVVDAGANRGDFTQLFSDIIGASGSVHAFEPVPPTFNRLQHRLESGVKNYVLNQCALGEIPGSALINLPDDDDGQASLRNHHDGSWKNPLAIQQFECTITTLDLYAAEFKRLDFLKCDVEGAELWILKGGRATLARLSPLLFLEVNPAWTSDFGSTPDDLVAELHSQGYDRLFLATDHLEPFVDTKFAGSANLLCAKSKLHLERLKRMTNFQLLMTNGD